MTMFKQSEKLVKRLKKYFEARDDVSMAFLFGSAAKGRQHGESDVDIGVYIKSSGISGEIEALTRYDCEDEIWSDVEEIVGREVDLVVLNRARSSICDVIVRTGIPLVIRNRRLFLWYLLNVSDLAEEFRDYILSLWGKRYADRSR